MGQLFSHTVSIYENFKTLAVTVEKLLKAQKAWHTDEPKAIRLSKGLNVWGMIE